jgi:RNA-directed DNA polymerase
MPTGNDTAQRADMKPAFSNDLFEQMLQPANVQQAWKQV